MNNNLIRREDLLKWIDDSVSQYGHTYSTDMLNMWELFKYYLINHAPTVEAYTFEQVKELFELSVQMANEIENLKRPTGEWINHRNNNGHNIADCLLCGKATQWHDEDEDGIPRYCWYCGAEMKGGAE